MIKINLEEEKARKSLDDLFEKEKKTMEDLNEIHCLIEDYLEQGYKFREYIGKYNQIIRDLNDKKE